MVRRAVWIHTFLRARTCDPPALGRNVLIAALFVAGVWHVAWSAEPAKVGPLGPVVLGGRFEYLLLLDEQTNPYPWNAATHSATDRSRLMLDLDVSGTRYGSLYAKGAAVWAMVGEDDIQKRLHFEQGDYLWRQDLEAWKYSIRLFASERRFFAFDWTAPLLDDDRAGETGENRGVRVDGAVGEKARLTGLYSLLGADADDSRSVSYLKASLFHRIASLSASYLFDDPGAYGTADHAVVKAELTSAYKRAFAVLSYEQSGFGGSGWFFPSGSFDWSGYDGTNFSAVLPPGGAAFAEIRVSSLAVANRGDVDLVWRYDAVGEDFVNDLGGAGSSRVGQTAGAYFIAKDVSVNAKLLYHTSARSGLENEERSWFDAGVWAALKNGTDCFLRGGAGEIDDESFSPSKKNFIHGALRYQMNKMRTGVHAMWSDLDTDYSGEKFAWDGKLALTPAWGFHWRFLLSRDYAVGRTAFFRLEFRPSNRLFACVGYGRSYLGDDPFVLEDREIGLLREGPSQYTISMRGDF